ncbi:MAG: thioredoxin [Candidatus Tectomicrobia bacterium]|uniref:Thioredoxin n=1 Tax=Tectimicrobiota bacterium TaxID=2528274 RepID=A0A933GL19_UNCTE|nr:thioredoxin [Candidatus Tectomicrobia bacterium]
MAKNVIEFSDQNFIQEVEKASGVTLVDFWAAWCGPCKMIAPVVEELSSEYEGKVKFGKVNVDENPSTASKYGIRSIPTLMVFKNGAMVDQIIGVRPKGDIKKALDKNLG